jgi:hypothetical protein
MFVMVSALRARNGPSRFSHATVNCRGALVRLRPVVAGRARPAARIGVLTLASQNDEEHPLTTLEEGLRSRGYGKGSNLYVTCLSKLP